MTCQCTFDYCGFCYICCIYRLCKLETEELNRRRAFECRRYIVVYDVCVCDNLKILMMDMSCQHCQYSRAL